MCRREMCVCEGDVCRRVVCVQGRCVCIYPGSRSQTVSEASVQCDV